MSRISYLQYGERALTLMDPLKATARPNMHRNGERLAILDITAKLDLQPTDRLLDIGGGIGNITIPLSFLVAETTVVDHPDCVARLSSRLPQEKVKTLGGNWLDVEIAGSFTKILAYDVIHYLASLDEVTRFLDKALRHLDSGGKMLVGDIPNAGVRARFDNSITGQSFNRQWNEILVRTYDEESIAWDRKAMADRETIVFNDLELLGLVAGIRKVGYQAWLVPQNWDLPFGTQREDLLVVRP